MNRAALIVILFFCPALFAQNLQKGSWKWSVSGFAGAGKIVNDLSHSSFKPLAGGRLSADINHLWNLSISASHGSYTSHSDQISSNGSTLYTNVRGNMTYTSFCLLTAFNITPEKLQKSASRFDFYIGLGMTVSDVSNSFQAPKDPATNSSIGIHATQRGNFGYFPAGIRYQLKLNKRISLVSEAEYCFYNSDLADGIWFNSYEKGRWLDHSMNFRAGFSCRL